MSTDPLATDPVNDVIGDIAIGGVRHPLVSLSDIESAAERLKSLIKTTPVDVAHALSRLAGRDILLKHEYLQRTGSYKVRGAFNCISRLSPGVEVVAASAGNHAQGVALAASMTGHTATIYMPSSAPLPKIEATKGYGADIRLVDGGVDESLALAIAHASESGAVFVPPFDNHEVIAGQGTVGLELARDLPAGTETVVFAIGGGGLISGSAVALKTLRPEIKIIGVEPENAAAMKQSLEAGECITLDHLSTMADGIAVRSVCERTLHHVNKYVDDIITVHEEAIGEAVLVLIERAKAVVEPAGAVSLAAILSGKVAGSGPACAVLSGGNIDPVLLGKVIDYGLTAAGRYLRLQVIMDDHAGGLALISKILAEMSVNVVLIEHHRSGMSGLAFNEVDVQLTLETKDAAQQREIIERMTNAGFHIDVIH